MRSIIEIFLAELIGTAFLIVLGCGTVANVVLRGTKGHASGWIVITTGWAMGVVVGGYAAVATSGAHLNPAVTVAFCLLDRVSLQQVHVYIAGQFLGAFLGAVIVWLVYSPHWSLTDDQDAKLGVFCTIPAIRAPVQNLLTEVLATFVLVFGALKLATPQNFPADKGWDRGMGPLVVGLLVWGIGLALGGPTGYAINPARDLAPRLAHAVLPIPAKRDADWSYAFVPVIGPLLGGMIAALVHRVTSGS
jgi:glycerol uptake facilitator protein